MPTHTRPFMTLRNVSIVTCKENLSTQQYGYTASNNLFHESSEFILYNKIKQKKDITTCT